MKLGHDTLMGVILILSGVLTVAYVLRNEQAVRTAAVVGALSTFVIGILLFFSLA